MTFCFVLFFVLLSCTGQVIETELYPDDPMINAILIGLVMGAALMSPFLVVCLCCNFFGPVPASPQNVAAKTAATKSPTAAAKKSDAPDEKPSPKKTAASPTAADGEVRKRKMKPTF
jgi:hypothetical protein